MDLKRALEFADSSNICDLQTLVMIGTTPTEPAVPGSLNISESKWS